RSAERALGLWPAASGVGAAPPIPSRAARPAGSPPPGRAAPAVGGARPLRPVASEAEEVGQQDLPVLGQDRFGMELNALDGPPAVAQPHHLPVVGARRDLELFRHRVGEDGQRVVPGGAERRGDAPEHAAAVVLDRGRLAVHLPPGARDRGAEGLADRLMAEADAEDRDARPEPADNLEGDARVVGCPRARRDHDPLRPHRADPGQVDRVVADDLGLGAEFAEVLDKVVGEGVVVVDDEDHDRAPAAAMRSASTSPRALEQVSFHSALGSESATIPAPTWTDARRPWQTIVRMVMQESRLPEYET